MVNFRIYTENKNLNTIKKLIHTFFNSYTLIECKGIYKGIEEKTLIIEIITPEKNNPKIELIAKAIKKVNNQECILLTRGGIESWTI